MWFLFASHLPLHLLESHVNIYGDRGQGQEFLGSGVQVKTEPNHGEPEYAVVTALHVLEGATDFNACGVTVQNGPVCVKVLEHVDNPFTDFTILEVNGHAGRPVKVKSTGLYLSQQVIVTGAPQEDLEVFKGAVVLTHTGDVDGHMYSQYGISGGWCNYGISGGGVYDTRGRLVALVHSVPSQQGFFGDSLSNSMCLVIAL